MGHIFSTAVMGIVALAQLETPGGDANLATKQYVKDAIGGRSPKGAVRAVLTLSDLAEGDLSYSAGAYTRGTNGSINDLNIRGVTDFAVGDSLLLRFADNDKEYAGPVTITALGGAGSAFAFARRDDFNSSGDVAPGSSMQVTDGLDAGAVYYLATEPGAGYVLDTTELTFAAATSPSGPTSGVATTVTGTDVDVNTDGTTIRANGDNELEVVDGSITEVKLGTGAVTNTKLGADAVNGSKIADGSIDTEHFAGQAVDTAAIADGAVDSDKLANNAVGYAKLATAVQTMLAEAVSKTSASTATTDATPVAMTFAALPNCPINTVAELDVIVKGTNDSDGSKTVALRSQVAVHRGGSGAVVVDDVDDFRPRGATGTGNLLGGTIAIVANGTTGDFDVILTAPAGVNAHWTGRVERR